MSVARSFAQRNTNEINVIPVYQESGEWDGYDALTIDPRYASVFNVDLSGFQYVSGWDVNDRVDVYGRVNSYLSPPIAYSYLNIDSGIATAYPGLQFTINFNYSEGINYSAYVSLYVNADPLGPHDGDGEADILSPGETFNNFNTASVTIRSNGTRWVVVSSGPVSWSGDWDWDL